MTSLDDLYPSPYIKASDIGEDGKIVTISRLATEQVGKQRQVKPVIYFEEYDKGMVLNKTNGKAIGKLHGTDIDDWPGKRIMLIETTTEFEGDTVAAIRVRPARTKAAPQRAVPRQDPISTGTGHQGYSKPALGESDFPGDRPMPKRRAAIDQDLDDDIEF